MDAIKQYPVHSDENNRLRAAAAVLELFDPEKHHFAVEDTYFDYGQGWKWTTIIAHDPTAAPGSVLESYQYLTPRDQEEIIFSDIKDLITVCEHIVEKRGKH